MRIVLSLLLSFSLLLGSVLAQPVDEGPLNEREELILTALEALLSAMPERALPLAQKVLNGDHRDAIKARALFVISQINLPEAQTVLLDYATNPNSTLNSIAIRNIGISGNADSLEALADIYTAGDDEVKHHVLEAYMIAGDTQAVYDIAANAQSDEEFDEALNMLGVMGATQELRQLVKQGASSESLARAYAISGDLEGLLELSENAEAAGNPELQVTAIRSIGIIGGEQANRALVDIYRNTGNESVKQAALHGLSISGDEQGLLELYRQAQDIGEKRDLLRMLSVSGGDAALEAIDSALEGNQP